MIINRIEYSKHSAKWNMELDNSLFHACESGHIEEAVLRFYGWDKISVTIGKNQSIDELNREAAAAVNVDIVNRPTGGRAVLHDGDISFSLIFSRTETYGKHLRDVYTSVSSAFIRAFSDLGIETDTKDNEFSGNSNFDTLCYETLCGTEIHVSGRKAAGWSARLSKKAALVQGTMYIDKPSTELHKDIFGKVPASDKMWVLNEQITGITENELMARLHKSFQTEFETKGVLV